MKQQFTITGRLTGILIALAVAWGCGEQADTARKPKVIRKKITVAAKSPSTARKKPSRPSSQKVVAPRPRSDIAKAKPPRGAPASSGKGAAVSPKTLRPKSDIARQAPPSKVAVADARKSSTQKQETPKTGAAALPASGSLKTALKPRSEPSKDKPAATPADAGKALASKKPAATGNSTAKKGGPPEAYNPTGMSSG